jgi:hypothetical protein
MLPTFCALARGETKTGTAIREKQIAARFTGTNFKRDRRFTCNSRSLKNATPFLHTRDSGIGCPS